VGSPSSDLGLSLPGLIGAGLWALRLNFSCAKFSEVVVLGSRGSICLAGPTA
jgi:hypothetical protein